MFGTKTLFAIRALMLTVALSILVLSIGIEEWWTALKAGCQASSVCNTHWYDSRLMAWRFSTFTGAFAISAAILGAVGVKVEKVPWLVVLVVDVLSGLFCVAGGVILSFMFANGVCDASGAYADYCRQVPADTAMLYVGFLVSLGAIVVGVFSRNKIVASREEKQGLRSATFV